MKRKMTDYSIPPSRDLPPGRLVTRQRHLRAELSADRRRPFPLRAGAAAALVAAIALTLLLISPWGSSPSLTDRALAAVGDGPVLHVVTERLAPVGWYRPVDIATGKEIPVRLGTEVWFDEERQLEKSISTMDGKVTEEMLQSPQGWFTREGPVYTCAWIAAHPVEATKARVSCNENMENGTTPRHIPEQPPTPLDPALAGFVDHYRSALASGEATQTGTGEVDGHDVIWLRIAQPEEDVAIDASSYQPLLIRDRRGNDSFRVTQVDTQAYDPSLFTRPEEGPPLPSISQTAGSAPISLPQGIDLLGGHALWLGETWNHYQLARVMKQDIVTGYGPLSGREPTHSAGIALEYHGPDREVLILQEAARCEGAYGWMCGRFPEPPEGTMLVLPIRASFLVRDGLFIGLVTRASDEDPVEVARALIAVPKAS
jgi:hypothetical protein